MKRSWKQLTDPAANAILADSGAINDGQQMQNNNVISAQDEQGTRKVLIPKKAGIA